LSTPLGWRKPAKRKVDLALILEMKIHKGDVLLLPPALTHSVVR
jgi:ribosomal protein L16 Arg81 hydroxylase